MKTNLTAMPGMGRGAISQHRVNRRISALDNDVLKETVEIYPRLALKKLEHSWMFKYQPFPKIFVAWIG